MKNLDFSNILFNRFKNRKSLLLGAIHKEHWPLLGEGVQLPTYSDLRGLWVSGLLKSATLLNSCTEDLVNPIQRLDHSLVKGSIITEMFIPWLLVCYPGRKGQ